jgi:peptidoglycan/LPS O-acetylase OafA/YrhL
MLRIVALALVAAQHILSLSNLDHWTNLGPINIGQLGVGIFLAISGLLARTANRPLSRPSSTKRVFKFR